MAKKMTMLVGLLFLGIQVAPYGRNHANPPVRQEPEWNGQSRQLAKRACFDCHSNETKWPWYASVAPFSWLIQNHVNEGREKLNFSEWDLPLKEAKEAAAAVEKGEMPLRSYLVGHSEARLQPAERTSLAAALRAMIQKSGPENAGQKDEAARRDAGGI